MSRSTPTSPRVSANRRTGVQSSTMPVTPTPASRSSTCGAIPSPQALSRGKSCRSSISTERLGSAASAPSAAEAPAGPAPTTTRSHTGTSRRSLPVWQRARPASCRDAYLACWDRGCRSGAGAGRADRRDHWTDPTTVTGRASSRSTTFGGGGTKTSMVSSSSGGGGGRDDLDRLGPGRGLLARARHRRRHRAPRRSGPGPGDAATSSATRCRAHRSACCRQRSTPRPRTPCSRRTAPPDHRTPSSTGRYDASRRSSRPRSRW